MPNIYSKPISSGFRNTYQSQFVPLPLEQFAKTNELNQAKQDAEVAQLTAASDSAWKISGIADTDNAYIAGIRETVDKAAADLTSKDLTKKENQDAVRGLIKNISRDKDLATIMANKAKYDEYQKNKEEAMKSGYQAYNDNFIGSYNEYVKGGGYKSGKSIDTTIYKYSEERPKMEEYFNNMGENGSDTLAKAGEVYYQNGWSGISADRITNSKGTGRAQQAFDSYIVTPEGQQGIRRFNALAASNPKFAEQFKGGANEYVFKEFLDAGLERVHGKSSSGRAAALNADADKKERRAKEKAETENLFTGSLNTETPSTLTNGKPVEFDEKGEIKGSGRPWKQVWDESSGVFDFLGKVYSDTRLNDDEAKDAAYITLGAKLNGVTPQQYAEVYNRTSHMKVDKPLIGKALDQNNKVLFNGGAGIWSTLNVMNTTTGQRNIPFQTAIQEVADEKGFDLPDPDSDPAGYGEALKKIGVSIIGQANPNEFSAKPVIFTVGNNKFAADMTFNGTNNPFKNKEELAKAQELQNLDRLNKGQQIMETDSKGRQVIYYKDIKTGQIKSKVNK